MNVIIVGPDGSGKTTLLNNISPLMKTDVIGCTFRTEDKIKESYRLLSIEGRKLFDRFFYPDDLVYSLVKGESLSDDMVEKYKEVEEELYKQKTIIIYLYAEVPTLVSRLRDRGDEYITIEEIPRIIEAYEEILSKTKLPVIKVKAEEKKGKVRYVIEECDFDGIN